jgi:hypothetical protein
MWNMEATKLNKNEKNKCDELPMKAMGRVGEVTGTFERIDPKITDQELALLLGENQQYYK